MNRYQVSREMYLNRSIMQNNTTSPLVAENEIQLSSDKDRLLLLAIKKINEVGGQFWARLSKDPKGGRQIRILDLKYNPILAIDDKLFQKFKESDLIIEIESTNSAEILFKINPLKTIKAS